MVVTLVELVVSYGRMIGRFVVVLVVASCSCVVCRRVATTACGTRARRYVWNLFILNTPPHDDVSEIAETEECVNMRIKN